MFEGILIFASDGGKIIYLIAFLIFIVWAMVFERAFFIFKFSRNKQAHAAEIIEKVRALHSQKPLRARWAHSVRSSEFARISRGINAPMSFIRSLIAICPLLGLLGTVTGMMELFYSISFFGTGNSRAILSAVSHTTIPTMAGMMAGLFGIAAEMALSRWAKNQLDALKRLIAV